MVTINERRLLDRIGKLGQIGKDLDGKRTRLAADDAEKLGRDESPPEAGTSICQCGR